MIKVIDKNNSARLYQWDQGREIAISADTDVVDFAHKNDAEAVRVKPAVKDGVLTASIPNSLLQSSQQIVAYLVKGDQTIYGQVLPVIPRQKPAEYVSQPDQIYSYVSLDKRIDELQAFVTELDIPSIDGLAGEDYVNDQVKAHNIDDQCHADLRRNIKSAKEMADDARQKIEAIHDWAKQPEKPPYTADEIGAAKATELFAFAIKTKTEVSEKLQIKDSAEYRLQGLSIFGKAEQLTTSGKNLFDADAIYGKFKTADGMYKMSCGDATKVEVSLDQYAGKTITFKFRAKCPSGVSYVCAIVKNSGNITKYSSFVNKGVTGICELSVKVVSGDLLSISCGSKTGESDTDIEVSELQLEIAPAATEYEPYTGGIASPNPEYPQDIVTADNPTVKCCGKNLYSGGDVSGVLSVTIPIEKIDAGTYRLSADSVSTDTDTPNKVKVAFKQRLDDKDVDIKIVGIARGHASEKVVLSDWANEVTFYAADSYSASVDDSFSVSNVQLELGDVETSYSQYKGRSIEINHTLCAVPVSSNGTYTDVDGQQWICDTIDFAEKKYIQRIKKLVLAGDEAWEKNTAYEYHYDLAVGDNLFDITINPILSSHYPNERNTGMYYGIAVDYAVMSVDGSRIRIKDARYQSDLDGFKAMLAERYADGDPVVIYYALKNPIETALTDAELENFKNLQTYYETTHVRNSLDCPMQVQYVADTKLYVDQQINAALESATARVASLEQYVVQT